MTEVIPGSELEPPALPEKPKYPAGLHVRLRFDADSCLGSVYEGETFIASGTYAWIKNCDSWDECRERALNDVLEKVAIIQKYGPPPENEVVELGDTGSV